MKKHNKSAVFLDRDGVIIKDVHYISKPGQIEFIKGSIQGIKKLNQIGYLTVVVTNQSGIARGYFTVDDYYKVASEIERQMENHGAKLDLVLFCPFHKDGVIKKYKKDSEYRKPGPGMFYEAREKLGIDFSKSWMVGDKSSDILAGKNLGIKTILVKTGYYETDVQPDYVCANLKQGVDLILKNDL